MYDGETIAKWPKRFVEKNCESVIIFRIWIKWNHDWRDTDIISKWLDTFDFMLNDYKSAFCYNQITCAMQLWPIYIKIVLSLESIYVIYTIYI